MSRSLSLRKFKIVSSWLLVLTSTHPMLVRLRESGTFGQWWVGNSIHRPFDRGCWGKVFWCMAKELGVMIPKAGSPLGHRDAWCWKMNSGKEYWSHPSVSASGSVGLRSCVLRSPLSLYNSYQKESQFPSNQEVREKLGFYLQLRALTSSHSVLFHLLSVFICVVIRK